MLGALLLLGSWFIYANPARKTFEQAEQARVAAAAAAEKSHQKSAWAAFEDFSRRAAPLEKARDWAQVEKLWSSFPAQEARRSWG